MTRPRSRPRPLSVVLVVAPTFAAAGVVSVLLATGTHLTVHATAPLTTPVFVTGVLLSLTVGVALWVKQRLRAAFAAGSRAGTEAERAAHRRFIARLDHELKNPVTAIRVALEANAGTTPGLTVAAGQADRLATLIGELRSIAALETASIEQEPVDVGCVVADEVTAFTEDLRSRGNSRIVEIHLPSAPWPLPLVDGDADLIAVAIRNLLINAAKYSDPDSRIEVRGYEDEGAVVLEVADTGWGIAPDEIGSVWDELWRGTEARRVEGTGLGLSLVQLVAHRHGGTATVRSLPGTGTSVRLRFPAHNP